MAGRTTTWKDRATQLLISAKLSLAIHLVIKVNIIERTLYCLRYLVIKANEVKIVKEKKKGIMACDISPVAMFEMRKKICLSILCFETAVTNTN